MYTYILQSVNDVMIIYAKEDGSMLTMPMESFEALFGSGPYTYASLISDPDCSDGWRSIFEQLHNDGVLN